MFSKVKYFLLASAIFASFSLTGYAEGDTYCTGRVTGVSELGNVNGGQTSFNSHQGPGFDDNEAVDLSIIEEIAGLAPASREYAACVNGETGIYEESPYEYGFHGFAWNDNLGFLSFSCQDGKNRAGEGLGVDCGPINYGVFIDAANELFGHAFSPAFGWIQFRGQGELADGGAAGGGGTEILSAGPNTVNMGDAMTIVLDGVEYMISASAGAGSSILNVTVNDVTMTANNSGDVLTFGDVDLVVNDIPKLLSYSVEEAFAPLPEQSAPVTLKTGESISMAFQGREYVVSVDAVLDSSNAVMTVNGSRKAVKQSLTTNFGEVDVLATVVLSPIEVGGPAVTFRLQEFPAPVKDGKGPYIIDQGETQSITVGGVPYEIALLSIDASDVSSVSQDGLISNFSKGETKLVSSLNFTANNVVRQLVFTLQKEVAVEAPGGTISPEYQIDAGDTMSISFEGQDYEINLLQTNPAGGGQFTINGDGPYWSGEESEFFSEHEDRILYGDIYINYVAGSYDEAFGESYWWRFTLQEVSAGGTPFDYGVTVDADGYLHGYAWTEASIWLNFEGVRIFWPEGDIIAEPDGASWCEGKPYLCVEVRPSPVTLEFGAGGDEEVRIADGVDGYYVHLFLRNGAGTGALIPSHWGVATSGISNRIASLFSDQSKKMAFTLIEFNPGLPNVAAFANSIRLRWEDTVKLDQTDGSTLGDSLSTLGDVDFSVASLKRPWSSGEGAVTYKPLVFSTNLALSDFTTVEGDPGHYISKEKIKAYGPTTEGNLSWTTSTDPEYLVNNDRSTETNRLVLRSVTHSGLSTFGGSVLLQPGEVHPNGKVNLALPFRPAIEVQLYSGVLQDIINAYRSVPENIAYDLITMGALSQAAIGSAELTATLSYDQSQTQARPNCDGATFDFHFLNSFAGADLSNSNPSVKAMTSLANVLIGGGMTNVQVLASLPVVEDAEELPCLQAAAPILSNKIEYQVEGRSVEYWHNGLPRIGGSEIFNPQIVVHGNIVGQKFTGVANASKIQASGSGVVSRVRDAVEENMKKYLGEVLLTGGKECTIVELNTNLDFGVTGCTNNTHFKITKIDDEYVMYFKNNDVVLDVDGVWNNKWVVIADGGDVFVHGDAYIGNPNNNRLSLLAFHNNNSQKGNVYLGPCSDPAKVVNNLQATIVADGGLMSYSGVKADIAADGRPVWGSPQERVNALGCQLFIEGSIYADNTIGGADLDVGQAHRPFLLLGGGEVKELPVSLDDRVKAQNDDLNYLRLFRLNLEISPGGLPIDQRCGKGLTPDDVLAISQGEVVCGEIQPCDPGNPDITVTSDNVCDGINPFDRWAGGNSFSGDLVPPQNPEFLAQGLSNDPESGSDFDPVYVYYVPPASDSFVFSKVGAKDIGEF